MRSLLTKICLIFLCVGCSTQYEKLGVLDGIKKEFAGVDFNKKTSLFVFLIVIALLASTTYKAHVRKFHQIHKFLDFISM